MELRRIELEKLKEAAYNPRVALKPGDAEFEKLAIAASTNGKFTDSPISPCGSCRQAILEYEKLGGQALKIYLYGEKEIYVLEKVSDLLPLQFDSF